MKKSFMDVMRAVCLVGLCEKVLHDFWDSLILVVWGKKE